MSCRGDEPAGLQFVQIGVLESGFANEVTRSVCHYDNEYRIISHHFKTDCYMFWTDVDES